MMHGNMNIKFINENIDSAEYRTQTVGLF